MLRVDVIARVIAGALLAPALLAGSAAAEWPYTHTGSGNEKWCSNPRVWNNVGNWPEYVTATDVARALWNAAPFNLLLNLGGSTGYEIYVGQEWKPTTSYYAWAAITDWADEAGDPTPFCFLKGEIKYNSAWRGSHGTVQQHIYRAVHEFGHILNLGHFPSTTDVMYEDTTPVSNGIWHPTYESIEALRALYGTQDTPFGGRSIVGSAGATPSNSFPTRIYTTSSSGTNYAMAYHTHGTWSVQKGMMVTGVVQGSTLHRFGLGLYASTDPADTTKRIATIELDNDGIKAVLTKPDDTLRIINIASAATNTDYFLQAVTPRMGDSNTYWATVCAWRVSDKAFLGCSAAQTSEMKYGTPPATVYGAMAAFTVAGNVNEYAPSRGSSSVH